MICSLIVSAVFFAGYLMMTQRARALATSTLTTTAVASGAVVLFIARLALHAPLTGYRPGSWAALIALGLIPRKSADTSASHTHW